MTARQSGGKHVVCNVANNQKATKGGVLGPAQFTPNMQLAEWLTCSAGVIRGMKCSKDRPSQIKVRCRCPCNAAAPLYTRKRSARNPSAHFQSVLNTQVIRHKCFVLTSHLLSAAGHRGWQQAGRPEAAHKQATSAFEAHLNTTPTQLYTRTRLWHSSPVPMQPIRKTAIPVCLLWNTQCPLLQKNFWSRNTNRYP
jgi:hypothetical protein